MFQFQYFIFRRKLFISVFESLRPFPIRLISRREQQQQKKTRGNLFDRLIIAIQAIETTKANSEFSAQQENCIG